MEEEINWKLASNSQLKEEIKRLEEDFKDKQDQLSKIVNKVDTLNKYLLETSTKYMEIKKILDKREGKTEQTK